MYWSDRKIRRELKKDKAADSVMGFWDGEKIVVNSSEPVWQQIEVTGHEIVHAAHDYALWLKQSFADPIKMECGESAMDLADED